MEGVMMTSLGGVKVSAGGSYGGMGVVRRVRAERGGGMKSACGLHAWGVRRFCLDGVDAGDDWCLDCFLGLGFGVASWGWSVPVRLRLNGSGVDR
jgi:hypothetical protein